MSSETTLTRKKRPATDLNPAPDGDHRKRYWISGVRKRSVLIFVILDVGTGQRNRASIAILLSAW